MGRLFGTDGVRGIANQELTPELAFRLGLAAGYFFGQEHTNPVFIIGRDTRISGQMLEAALAAGICSAGGKAVLAGVIPTPAVAYLTRTHQAQAGIVISASHNPFPDNGIKFFAGTGYKLPDEVEDKLEELVKHPERTVRPVGDKVGTIQNHHDLVREYIEYVLSTVTADFSGLKVVLDCANGAAFEVAPVIFKRLGAEVVIMNHQPTGSNINHDCGSTHLAALQKAVVKHQADFGIAHDGDADRCLAVDEHGHIVDGDQLMVICACELMKENKLQDNTLVVTVMSNIGLHKAMKQAGGKVKVTPVGDRYVLEEMLAHGAVLGGEQSGHIIFGGYATTGDGLITATQLVSAIKKNGQPLSVLANIMTRYPQILVNVHVLTKEGWNVNAAIQAAIKNGEQELGEEGRILVRPSGTEPLIRVMAEGTNLPELKTIVNRIADVVRQEQGAVDQ